jgi:hypothetical protein
MVIFFTWNKKYINNNYTLILLYQKKKYSTRSEVGWIDTLTLCFYIY